jgi:hypothetical protein
MSTGEIFSAIAAFRENPHEIELSPENRSCITKPSWIQGGKSNSPKPWFGLRPLCQLGRRNGAVRELVLG